MRYDPAYHAPYYNKQGTMRISQSNYEQEERDCQVTGDLVRVHSTSGILMVVLVRSTCSIPLVLLRPIQH